MEEVKLIDQPSQNFFIQRAGKNVQLQFSFNETSQGWTMDIGIDDVWYLQGRRVVPNINLIDDVPVLRDLGYLVAINLENPLSYVFDRDSFPSGASQLFFIDDEEIANYESPVDSDTEISATVSGLEVEFKVLDYNADAIYDWVFGDGTIGYGAQVTKLYPRSGAYIATLKVSDGRGLTKEFTKAVQV